MTMIRRFFKLILFLCLGKIVALQSAGGNNYSNNGGGAVQSEVRIDTYVNHVNGLCNAPKENNQVHACDTSISYPRNLTLCYCINYRKEIKLMCNNNIWYINGKTGNPCSDKVTPVLLDVIYQAQPHPVQYAISTNCDRPLENESIFHSCDNAAYPRQDTTCYCNSLIETKLNLVCVYFQQEHVYKWIINGLKCQTTQGTSVGNTAVVRYDDYKPGHLFHGKCYQPQENLNYYHSCTSNGLYPQSKTTCNCTFNQDYKIDFFCYYGTWYRADSYNPCKHVDSSRVLCYRDTDTKQVICTCKLNCFALNFDQFLTDNENDAYKNCHISTGVINNGVYKNLISHWNGTHDSKKIRYSCNEGYKLVGHKELFCNYGKLSGSLPKCIIARNNSENRKVTTVTPIDNKNSFQSVTPVTESHLTIKTDNNNNTSTKSETSTTTDTKCNERYESLISLILICLILSILINNFFIIRKIIKLFKTQNTDKINLEEPINNALTRHSLTNDNANIMNINAGVNLNPSEDEEPNYDYIELPPLN